MKKIQSSKCIIRVSENKIRHNKQNEDNYYFSLAEKSLKMEPERTFPKILI